MASGIAPADDSLAVFKDIKMNHSRLYVIYKIDGNAIIVDKIAEKGATYEDFVNDMQERISAGCYAVVDYPFQKGDTTNSLLAFVSLISDDLPTKARMLYASSMNNLKRKLEGIKFNVQATTMDEISTEAMNKNAEKK